MIRIKRAYEPRVPADGYRVLVDRLWPRGLSKQAAHLDAWMKDVAPSDALRKWFGHDAARFREFRVRYKAELASSELAEQLLDELVARAGRRTVTLVYAAHDEAHNNAVVLAEELERLGASRRRPARPSRAHA